MNITVIGPGRWGSFIAWYLNEQGHQVTLYGRKGSKHMDTFLKTRANGLLTLPPSISLTQELRVAMENEYVVISVNAQGLRSLLAEMKEEGLQKKTLILCMKGMEISTGKRLTEVCEEFQEEDTKTAVWLGPGHVQEFYQGIPNCMVIDSKDEETKAFLVEQFSSELIRFYYGTDLVGNEIGGAAKNVMGIAAGMLDGLGRSSLKGALMSRGAREISRFMEASGGNPISAYGLCHLGDYEATVFSKHSHNRQFGEDFVKGKTFDSLAEGYYTVKALLRKAKELGVELPICQGVYDVLFEGMDAKETLQGLFLRSIKEEF